MAPGWATAARSRSAFVCEPVGSNAAVATRATKKPTMLAAWLASIDYAATPTGHPPSLAIREDRILAALDRSLVGLFAPDRVAEVARAVIDADQQANAEYPDVAQARRTMATDRRKIERHLAALEARPRPDPHRGGHQAGPSRRRRRTTSHRQRARHARPGHGSLSPGRAHRPPGTADELDDADTDLRAGMYRSLGIMLAYRRESGAEYIKVQAETQRRESCCVSEGGLRRLPHENAVQRGDAGRLAGLSRAPSAAHRGRSSPPVGRAVDKHPHASTGL